MIFSLNYYGLIQTVNPDQKEEWIQRMKKPMKLGEILINAGLITEEKIRELIDRQRETGLKLGELLVKEKVFTEELILKTLEFQLGIKYYNLNDIAIDPEIPKIIPEGIARKYNLIPISFDGNNVTVAMSDPLDMVALDDLRLITGKKITIGISSKADILRCINTFYTSSEDAAMATEEFTSQMSGAELTMDSEEDEKVVNAPVVRLVNSIISQAVKSRTSDIHIEPFERNVRVRYRVDGELKETMSLPKSIHSAISTRIKIMGKMDIAEKRIPQDGRVETTIEGSPIDMRISLLPTVYGEKIVIRLLSRNALVIGKKELGFTEKNMELFDRIIKAPEGIILLTGPTGSGKTTTLYAVLKELNQINKNIITVEDPVEYRLTGINQVQVNAKAGLTFASGLRSILRQDPDIVMVGEIRDAETAQIATRASITGHLVLSTLHTNDTASTISRLEDMGIETFMVSSAVVGIIAQRLVKKICPKCKKPYTTGAEEMKALQLDEPTKIYRGQGCNSCDGTGYSGRTAIHEILVMDREIRTMINKNENTDKIKDEARQKGMMTLNESCKELVLSGVTTVDEMIKITYSIDS